MRKLIVGLAILACGVKAMQAQWTMQDSHSTADLRGIHNVGNGIAWASGTNGTVLRTLDDGATWTACAIPPGAEKLDFRGIQAFDTDTAIVMSSGKGDLSRLYKTTDGCKSWKLVFTNPDKDGFWDAMQITSKETALVVGDPIVHRALFGFRMIKEFLFPLFGSIDGGENWKRIDSNILFARSDHKKVLQALFAASNSVLLEIPNRQMIIFVTGGAVVSLEILQTGAMSIPPLCKSNCALSSTSNVPLKSGPTAGGFSLAIANGESQNPILVVVGGDYASPDNREGTSAICSLNRKLEVGTNFNCEASAELPHGYRSAVAYDADTRTWITVGPNGTDISTDDGRNWRPVHPDAALSEAPDADRNWNALSLPFVAGPHGRIGKLDAAAIKSAMQSK